MDVFVCGFNGFDQFGDLPKGDANDAKNIGSDNISYGKTIKKPEKLSISLNIRKEHDLLIHFTWSRLIAYWMEGDKGFWHITGFGTTENERKDEVENLISVASNGDGSVVLLEKTYLMDKISVLEEQRTQYCSLTLKSGTQNAKVKVNLVDGGHHSFYTIYDEINIGMFKLPGLPNSSMTVDISHIDCVPNIKEISCGNEHVLLLSVSGNVYSFGLSSRGQLGHGEIESESSPRLIEALDGLKISKIAAGAWHSTAVSEIGDLYVWGWNEKGQLGLATNTTSADVPVTDGIVLTPTCVDIPNSENVKSVVCGSQHTIVLTDCGQAYASGWNAYGQLGLGDTSDRSRFTLVQGIKADKIFAGNWNSAFVCNKDQELVPG